MTDIHFYGQGSRKRSMQNASNDPVSKRAACVSGDTMGQNSNSHTIGATSEITGITSQAASETTSQATSEATSQAAGETASQTTSQKN